MPFHSYRTDHVKSMSKSAKQNNIAIGIHAVNALLKSAPQRIIQMHCLKGKRDLRLQKVLELANKLEVPVRMVDGQQLEQFGEALHQGVVAECTVGELHDEAFLMRLLESLQQDAFLLVLDGVTDPHNLGACLRTANAAGVHAVIAPKDKAVGINATVRKVASGAAELVPFIPVTNLARTLKSLQQQGVWLVGTADDAEQDIYGAPLTGPLAVVMGAEGSGLRRLTREACDFLVSIPMRGEVSSLNVSVATGVCLFEAVRQRQSVGKPQ